MEEAAGRLNSSVRRRFATSSPLQRVQSQHFITAEGERDVDVFVIVGEAGISR
jgi:hypothetical protein